MKFQKLQEVLERCSSAGRMRHEILAHKVPVCNFINCQKKKRCVIKQHLESNLMLCTG